VTFTIRLRGTSSGPLACEYMCPEHGRFDALVDRNSAGDPPASVVCPMNCELEAEHVISAPMGRVRLTEVARGKADDKPTPLALDTQALADGMPMKEWKARRASMWRTHDYAEFKKNT